MGWASAQPIPISRQTVSIICLTYLPGPQCNKGFGRSTWDLRSTPEAFVRFGVRCLQVVSFVFRLACARTSILYRLVSRSPALRRLQPSAHNLPVTMSGPPDCIRGATTANFFQSTTLVFSSCFLKDAGASSFHFNFSLSLTDLIRYASRKAGLQVVI